VKYLVLFVVAIVALTLLKRQRPDARPRPAPRAEPMHACARCGVNVPASACSWRGDKPYCCADHARLG
jgi:uncharacterized protein